MNRFNKDIQLTAALHNLNLNDYNGRESARVLMLTQNNCSKDTYHFPIGDKIEVKGYGIYDSVRRPYYPCVGMRVKLGGVPQSQIKWYQFVFCEN